MSIPVTGPGVGDLVIRLVLWSTKIKQQLAIWSTAFIVVRDRRAFSTTVYAVDDCVDDAGAIGEGGLEVEVHIGCGG